MRMDVMQEVVEPWSNGQPKDVMVPLFRCHLCSGCSVTESPGGVGVKWGSSFGISACHVWHVSWAWSPTSLSRCDHSGEMRRGEDRDTNRSVFFLCIRPPPASVRKSQMNKVSFDCQCWSKPMKERTDDKSDVTDRHSQPWLLLNNQRSVQAGF